FTMFTTGPSMTMMGLSAGEAVAVASGVTSGVGFDVASGVASPAGAITTIMTDWATITLLGRSRPLILTGTPIAIAGSSVMLVVSIENPATVSVLPFIWLTGDVISIGVPAS